MISLLLGASLMTIFSLAIIALTKVVGKVLDWNNKGGKKGKKNVPRFMEAGKLFR